MLLNPEGNVINSEIVGTMKMKVNLTGMPELKLGLNDKMQYELNGKVAKNRTIELYYYYY